MGVTCRVLVYLHVVYVWRVSRYLYDVWRKGGHLYVLFVDREVGNSLVGWVGTYMSILVGLVCGYLVAKIGYSKIKLF